MIPQRNRTVPLLTAGLLLLAFVAGPGAVSAESGTARPAPCPAASLDRKTAAPLTLRDCLAIALRNNPDIQAAREDAAAARAGVDEVAGQRWPHVDLVGNYTRHMDDQRLVPARRPMEPGTYGDNLAAGDVVVRFPFYTGGRITSEIRASELLRQSSLHRLTRTRRAVIFNVSSVFYAILARKKVIESLEFSEKTLKRHENRVQDLMDVQRAARVDLLRTEVRLADIHQRLVRERNILDIQHRLLANLLGIENRASPLTVRGTLHLSPVTIPLERALAGARRARADYKALKAETEAQARRVDAARAGHRPTVSLEGGYGGRWALGSATEQAGADDSEDTGRVGVMVDFPIFRGGSVAARIRKEERRLRALKERLRKLDLRIRLDVETALLNIASNLERVRSSETAIEQGKESLRIEQEKYALGRGSITDVLDAQAALLTSQTNYYRSLSEYNTSIAELHLAIGEEE